MGPNSTGRSLKGKIFLDFSFSFPFSLHDLYPHTHISPAQTMTERWWKITKGKKKRCEVIKPLFARWGLRWAKFYWITSHVLVLVRSAPMVGINVWDVRTWFYWLNGAEIQGLRHGYESFESVACSACLLEHVLPVLWRGGIEVFRHNLTECVGDGQLAWGCGSALELSTKSGLSSDIFRGEFLFFSFIAYAESSLFPLRFLICCLRWLRPFE